MLYNEGKGVEKDHREAVRLLRYAAAHGLADAQLELGILRAIGPEGVTQDAVQAYVWFHLAAEQGDERAARHRGRVAAMLLEAEHPEARRRIAAHLGISAVEVPSPSEFLQSAE